MPKRVNLADLAREEVPASYSPVPTRSPAVRSAADEDRRWLVALEAFTLPIDQIAVNPFNERPPDEYGGEKFDQLVETIRQHGVLQPTVVCTAAAFLERYPDARDAVGPAQWVGLMGNRRLLAARAAGETQIPALINDERVASMYEVMLIENSHRQDLSPLREAEAMSRVLADEGISQRELAGRIGRTNVYVHQRIVLLGLIPELRAALEAGVLKLEQARQIGGLEAAVQQKIADAGPPYRKPSPEPVNAVNTRRRTITASSPAAAAESIRRAFTRDELAELLRLLSEEQPELE